MPFAQHHYPFENKELFERHVPADFISEAVDQTRGDVYKRQHGYNVYADGKLAETVKGDVLTAELKDHVR